jgi:hypothetical protein
MAYNSEIAAKIITRLIDGEMLNAICEDPGMPHRTEVLKWTKVNADFKREYDEARELAAHSITDDIIRVVENERDPSRARVKMDARKHLAAKYSPGKFGERIEVVQSLPPDVSALLERRTIKRLEIDLEPDDWMEL